MMVELRQIDTDRLLAALEVGEIGDVPHPGRLLESAGRSFLVLQRRHRYQLRNGEYQLASVALQVKPQRQPGDARWWHNQWVIGDPSCRYNARTPPAALRRAARWPLRALRPLPPARSPCLIP